MLKVRIYKDEECNLIILVELASTKKDLEQANEKLANTNEQLLNEKEEHQAEVDELQEKVIFMSTFPTLQILQFANINVNQDDGEYREKFESLQAEYEKQCEELEDIKGKYDRSILRKQKERAIKQLDEANIKIQKLEAVLAARESEVGQLQSLADSSK